MWWQNSTWQIVLGWQQHSFVDTVEYPLRLHIDPVDIRLATKWPINYLMGYCQVVFLICWSNCRTFVPWNGPIEASWEKQMSREILLPDNGQTSRRANLMTNANCSRGISRLRKNFKPPKRFLNFFRLFSSILDKSTSSGFSFSWTCRPKKNILCTNNNKNDNDTIQVYSQ